MLFRSPEHFCRATLSSRHAGPSGLAPRRTLSLGLQASLCRTLNFGATSQLQAQASLPGLAASRSPSLQLPPSARRKAATSQSLRDCFKTPSQGGPPPGSLQELTRPARQRPHSSYRAHSSRARSGSRAPSLHSSRAAFSPGTLRRNWAFDVPPVSAHFTFRSSVLPALGPQGRFPRAPATPHPFLRPRPHPFLRPRPTPSLGRARQAPVGSL